MHSTEDNSDRYRVLVNAEGRYSLWPEQRENPTGWSDAGKTDSRAECLSYIGLAWRDMRPFSVRKKTEEINQWRPRTKVDSEVKHERLVDRLCFGVHSVIVVTTKPGVEAFQQALERRYLHLRFPETGGSTELAVVIDHNSCNFSQADFNSGTGTVHLEGDLVFDGMPVRCIADLCLNGLEGKGKLINRGHLPITGNDPESLGPSKMGT